MPRGTTERQTEGEIIRLIEESGSRFRVAQLFARRCRNRSSRFQTLGTGEKELPIKISIRESTLSFCSRERANVIRHARHVQHCRYAKQLFLTPVIGRPRVIK